jgi:hypothetical protein
MLETTLQPKLLPYLQPWPLMVKISHLPLMKSRHQCKQNYSHRLLPRVHMGKFSMFTQTRLATSRGILSISPPSISRGHWWRMVRPNCDLTDRFSSVATEPVALVANIYSLPQISYCEFLVFLFSQTFSFHVPFPFRQDQVPFFHASCIF